MPRIPNSYPALEYATPARQPAPPLLHRCLRTALFTSVAYNAVTGLWAEYNWPPTTHWGYEKRVCLALIQEASKASLTTFALAALWLLLCPWYRRSPLVHVALWSSLSLGLYFGTSSYL